MFKHIAPLVLMSSLLLTSTHALAMTNSICSRLMTTTDATLSALQHASRTNNVDFVQLEEAFFSSLRERRIRFEDISSVEYRPAQNPFLQALMQRLSQNRSQNPEALRALEGLPTEHEFEITLTNGTVSEVNVVLLTRPRTTASAASQIEALIEGWGENPVSLRRSFDESIANQGIALNQIQSIEHTMTLESLPPKHILKLALVDGSLREVVVRAERRAPLTTLPLPVVSDTEALVNTAIARSAEKYEQNAEALRRELNVQLLAKGITLNDIQNIQYRGALESLPPQHQFQITLRNGTVTGVSVIVSMQGGAPAPVNERAPLTTLPLPSTGNPIEAHIDQFIRETAGAHGAYAVSFRRSFDESLADQGIALNRIQSIELSNVLESNPIQYEIKVTLVDGTEELITVSAPMTRGILE